MASLFSRAAVALLCLTSAFAAPAPAPISKRAISPELLSRLELFGQFAAASYCPGNNDTPNTELDCEAGNCPRVEAAVTRTLTEFENSILTDVTGYVAIDSTNGLIVVSFRGTQSVRNILTDANFALIPTDICTGCRGFKGFYLSWLEARPGVVAAVRSAAAANPDYQIAVTGHSLGGAIAGFAAAHLRNIGFQAALYSYGAPRIGGPALSSYISNQAGGNYRVTHTNDPIPRLPPLFLGYVHISPEYFIRSGNGVPVTAADVEVYPGAVNTGGNTGAPGADFDAHQWYFNEISGCGDGGFEPRMTKL